jgi:hypothetical protein
LLTITQTIGQLTLLGALVLLVSGGGCTDAAPVGGVASSSSARAPGSARAYSSAELAWEMTPMPPGHPVGVTGAAIRSAVELDGEIAVVFFRPVEKIEPPQQAKKILELMRPSFSKSTKVVVVHPDEQSVISVKTDVVFMRRAEEWRQDATAEEGALIDTLLRDVPGGATAQ